MALITFFVFCSFGWNTLALMKTAAITLSWLEWDQDNWPWWFLSWLCQYVFSFYSLALQPSVPSWRICIVPSSLTTEGQPMQVCHFSWNIWEKSWHSPQRGEAACRAAVGSILPPLSWEESLLSPATEDKQHLEHPEHGGAISSLYRAAGHEEI